jgi:phospholipase/carboxylesterase
MALSCYLVAPDRLASEAAQGNRDVPIFMAHGTADPVVRFEWGDASRRTLEASGYKVEWHAYRMEHSVCGEEISDISAWLQRVLVDPKAA